MPYASGSNAQLNYVTEETWGTTPGTPSMKKIRHTGESIEGTTQSIESQEFRSDRMVGAPGRGAIDVQGGWNFEFSHASFDDFLASLLFNAWDDTTKKSNRYNPVLQRLNP